MDTVAKRSMHARDRIVPRALLVVGSFVWLAVSSPLAGQIPGQNPLNEDPLRPRGQNVIPIFDGWFEEDGPELQGRRGLWAGPHTVRANEPLPLTAWIRHSEPGTWLGCGRNPPYGFEFHCCWTNGYVRVDVVDY